MRRRRPLADDPVALRSPRMARFFAGVMERQMRASFRAVRLLRPGLPGLPEGRPLAIFCNHPSWWDPAFGIVLAARLFPEREGYAPMEAAALERYRFMRRIGIFGVEPGTRAGAARFLQVAGRVWEDPARMIWITAQGGFTDPRARPVALRAGLAHVLARTPGAVALPLAVEYPFWGEKRPEALAAFGAPIEGGADAGAWQGRLEDGLTAAMDRLAGAATARDPSAFAPLLGGRAGVGGMYGAWGRARAALRGARHVPDHAPHEAPVAGAETGSERR